MNGPLVNHCSISRNFDWAVLADKANPPPRNDAETRAPHWNDAAALHELRVALKVYNI